MSVLTGGLFVVCEGQHGLAHAAALWERLLVQLILDVSNQDLRKTDAKSMNEGKH